MGWSLEQYNQYKAEQKFKEKQTRASKPKKPKPLPFEPYQETPCKYSARLVIPRRLPCLNDYTKANNKHRLSASEMKKDTQQHITDHIILCKLKPINSKVIIHFTWVEKNKKRDKDNIAFAKKFIQDALVNYGILNNDGWRNIEGFTDKFGIDPISPRVIVDFEIIE